MSVVAIGDNCLDVYVEQGVFTVGGNALNVAASWRASGLDARYLGAVGNDPTARYVLAALDALGLDHNGVDVLPGLTGVTLIRLRDQDREFLFEEFGVGLDWRPTDVLASAGEAQWHHVVATSPGAGVREALAAAGRRVSVDISTRPFGELHGVEVAFASSSGDADEAEVLATALCDAGARVGVVLRGAEGSLAREGRETACVRAEPIEPVDTCGAGDSFIAGFVAGRLGGSSLEQSLAIGTASATRTCLHLGGFPQREAAIPKWIIENYYGRVPGLQSLGSSGAE